MDSTDVTQASAGESPLLEICGAVATITLRRPQVANRLELSDLDTLRAHLEKVDAMPDVLVLVLRGVGRHFCSGFNIGEMDGSVVGAHFEALTHAMEQARPVTIAVLNGGAYGGATDLALACDFRLGVPACEMFVPAARLGLLFYRGGLERYVSRLGLAVAKRVLLTGEKFDARQMHDCGFLDTLLPDTDALEAEVARLTTALSGMAPLALLGMKRHLNSIAAGRFDAEAFRRDVARADASEDLREGARAWMEKRAPRFRGQ